MSEMRTVLVAGGTGFIGTHLCKFLRKNGYGIQIVSRMPSPMSISWNDLTSKGLPEKVHAVVNLSGQNVLDMKQRWTPGFKQNVYNSRINTNKALANAIMDADHKPKVFVTISGVGIYKPDIKREYNEYSDVEGYDFLSKMCLDWEKAARLEENACRQVNIRSGVVLERNGGMIQQLYTPFFFGLGGPVMPGSQYLPWIHMMDLCRLFLFCIENEKLNGTLNGVAPQIITNSDFSEAFAKAMRRPNFFPVPEMMLNIMLGRDRASMLTKGQKVFPKRVLDKGFTYKFPNIEDACKEIVAKPSN
ncbi:epimerase family protein SDR39U1 [Harmonia axyridis]|uniref:epimerase family protein SDR39U1 n=1 Tax=Harmonia axyridis TaxID=115357 RepID=UPI001E27609D|nr:epimerase family protein SDR39U1 [Harmonia axyridis]